MAPATPTTHDPALSHAAPPNQGSQPAQAPVGLPSNITAADLPGITLNGLDQTQIMNLLRSLPVFSKAMDEQARGNPKEDAAQTLSNLAQAPFGSQHIPGHYPPGGPSAGMPGINDPGPSSHPRGPPNLGQLSAVAMQAAPVIVQGQQQPGRPEDGTPGGEQAQNASANSSGNEDGQPGTQSASTSAPTGGRRGGRSATMGSDEWSRQRKDNHKEVERRRRGNINEGINELGRIVPSGSGEKAKGAILSRAVQYIHHLKENEARNIEKWTLEKLLMDQAMGDLQAQLEEVKRMWEEERMARTRIEADLEVLRNMNGLSGGNAGTANANGGAPVPKEEGSAGTKRRSVDGQEAASGGAGETASDAERDGKRQRTE